MGISCESLRTLVQDEHGDGSDEAIPMPRLVHSRRNDEDGVPRDQGKGVWNEVVYGSYCARRGAVGGFDGEGDS